jgi:protoheme IX farnesyltransferase
VAGPLAGLDSIPVSQKLSAYWELTKPRVTVLILLVAIAGFWLGSNGVPDTRRLFDSIVGISFLAAGIFALNQYLERDVDAVMRRTEGRPLPLGKLRPAEACWFGIIAASLGVVLLTLVNALSGLLALFTLGSYLFVYTPLKRRTPHCTLIGAFPGAVPPLLGWVTVRGELSVEAWVLFAILFFWQFPHFHAIAWLYRQDYARADIRVWPVVEPEGKTTFWQIIVFTCFLLPVSVLPSVLGLSGRIYFFGAVILGVWLLRCSIQAAIRRSERQAQRLLLASVLYLPALLGLMVLDKR